MKKIKRICSMLLALTCAVSLTACGGSGGSSLGSSSDSGKAEKTEKEQRTDLIVGVASEGSSMDPQGNSTRQVIENMILGLTDLDPQGNVLPGIASEWTVSEDEMEYLFTIDTSIQFANGDYVTAEDVKFSLDRGAQEESNAARYEAIKEVQIVDDTHIKLLLNYPCALLLPNLACAATTILNQDVVEEAGDDFSINSRGACAGPYDFVSWTKGVNIKLEANPYYKKDLAIKNIEFRFISEASTGVISVETGDVDVYMDPSYVDVQNLKSDKIKVHSQERNGFEFLGFCLAKSPYDDVRVRQAIAYSFDSTELVEAAIGGDGATPAKSFLPDFVFGSTELEGYPHDPEKAKELLAEAGYPDGLDINIVTMDSGYMKVAEYLQEAMSASGFRVNIEQTEYSKFVSDLIDGNLDAFIIGVTEDYPDADLTLYAQFKSDGGQNVHFYSNDRVDELLLNARQSSDEEARKEMYAEAQEILMDELPALPLYFSKSYALYNGDLENFTTNFSAMIMVEHISWGESEEQ